MSEQSEFQFKGIEFSIEPPINIGNRAPISDVAELITVANHGPELSQNQENSITEMYNIGLQGISGRNGTPVAEIDEIKNRDDLAFAIITAFNVMFNPPRTTTPMD